MTTIRIVLKEPFMLFPAGTVFELDEATGVSGWDPDERVRERLSFSDNRTYNLPDMGRGRAVPLPANATLPCPPNIFEGSELCSGPCRVTENGCGRGEILLAEINGIPKQGLDIPESGMGSPPVRFTVQDVLRDEQVQEATIAPAAGADGFLRLDFSALAPGFYQLLLYTLDGSSCAIRFIKSFPLLVIFENDWKFRVQKTLY